MKIKYIMILLFSVLLVGWYFLQERPVYKTSKHIFYNKKYEVYFTRIEQYDTQFFSADFYTKSITELDGNITYVYFSALSVK